MPRRTLNTKAATTWLKDSSQIVAEKVVFTALKRREHCGATDATRQSEIRGYIYQQKTGSYLPAEKANTTAETRRKIPAQADLERICVECFFRKWKITQRRILYIGFPSQKPIQPFARKSGQPPPRIRNGGSEEVVTKPKITQHRNHIGRHYPRKCKPQRAENPTVRVSRNGTEIPRDNF